MFLHLMNDKQKLEFLKLGRRMMDADDVVLDTEKAYLYRLFREAGLTAAQRSSVGQDTDADMDVFDTPRARIAVCVEILILAHIDGDFGAAELSVAEEIFDHMGIGGDERTRIERAAQHIAEAVATIRDMTS